MQDLRRIAANDALLPWIKTLTFEPVALVQRQCPSHRRHYHYEFAGRLSGIATETTDVDDALQRYMPVSRSLVDQELSQILPLFLNLTALRFRASNNMTKLVIWLTSALPTPSPGIYDQWRYECIYAADELFGAKVLRKYTLSDTIIAVLGALDKAGTTIVDLITPVGRFLEALWTTMRPIVSRLG